METQTQNKILSKIQMAIIMAILMIDINTKLIAEEAFTPHQYIQKITEEV